MWQQKRFEVRIKISTSHFTLVGSNHESGFRASLTTDKHFLRQPAIGQTTEAGPDRLSVMFYQGCKRYSGVSVAARRGEGQQINPTAAPSSTQVPRSCEGGAAGRSFCLET